MSIQVWKDFQAQRGEHPSLGYPQYLEQRVDSAEQKIGELRAKMELMQAEIDNLQAENSALKDQDRAAILQEIETAAR